jgi:hypothetical protein
MRRESLDRAIRNKAIEQEEARERNREEREAFQARNARDSRALRTYDNYQRDAHPEVNLHYLRARYLAERDANPGVLRSVFNRGVTGFNKIKNLFTRKGERSSSSQEPSSYTHLHERDSLRPVGRRVLKPLPPSYYDNLQQTQTQARVSNNGGKKVVKKATKATKKIINGKERSIYKKSGSRKEYIKYKGKLIAVKKYKAIMKKVKAKAKPKRK